MDCREAVEKLTSSETRNHMLDLEKAMAKKQVKAKFLYTTSG